jgi:hypothetical protein
MGIHRREMTAHSQEMPADTQATGTHWRETHIHTQAMIAHTQATGIPWREMRIHTQEMAPHTRETLTLRSENAENRPVIGENMAETSPRPLFSIKLPTAAFPHRRFWSASCAMENPRKEITPAAV